MDWTVTTVFLVVYFGMLLGRLPGLALDRSGVALLGALVLIVVGKLSTEEAWESVDVSTLALLLGLMIVSAQLRMGGFYAEITRWVGAWDLSPVALLAAMMSTAAILSALLTNDIVCLAMAPILIAICAGRGLRPLPHLLGLACAANIGSAATLIGNPQNILIGETLDLDFGNFVLQAIPPTALGLIAAWLLIACLQRGQWTCQSQTISVAAPAFRKWPVAKGLVVLAGIMAGFVFTSLPREIVALGGAAFLLLSRQNHTRDFLGLVDLPLLVLFAGLFVVNHAFETSGEMARVVSAAHFMGIDLSAPGCLFGSTVLLSNIVSNVPAVILLLPIATHSLAGLVLALASTLAGNLLVVGSVANMIVVDQAAHLGVIITWRDHVRVGVPVTMATLLIAAVWIWAIA